MTQEKWLKLLKLLEEATYFQLCLLKEHIEAEIRLQTEKENINIAIARSEQEEP